MQHRPEPDRAGAHPAIRDAAYWARVHLNGDRNPPLQLIRGKVFAFPAQGAEVRNG